MNTIEIISIIISALSLITAVYIGITSKKRNEKNDTKKETSELTSVIIELKYISSGITDIKHDISNVKDETRHLRDRVVAGEQSIKQAHKRLDEHEQRLELINKN